jgi:hypothetical protein
MLPYMAYMDPMGSGQTYSLEDPMKSQMIA